jgi:hypothetical protein
MTGFLLPPLSAYFYSYQYTAKTCASTCTYLYPPYTLMQATW